MFIKKPKYLFLILFYLFHSQNSNTNFNRELTLIQLKEYMTTIGEYKKTIGAIIVLAVIYIGYKLNSKSKIIEKIKLEFSYLIQLNNKLEEKIENMPETDGAIEIGEGKHSIEDIRKKINEAFKNTIKIINELEINTEEDFEKFLNKLNELLNYIKNIENMIEKVWHNGKCEEYNKLLNNLLQTTISSKLLQCLKPKDNLPISDPNMAIFDPNMFEKYLNFINNDNLEYKNYGDINEKPNSMFSYYSLLDFLWYKQLNKDKVVYKLQESDYECLLNLPLEKSLLKTSDRIPEGNNISYNILHFLHENYINNANMNKSLEIKLLYKKKYYCFFISKSKDLMQNISDPKLNFNE